MQHEAVRARRTNRRGGQGGNGRAPGTVADGAPIAGGDPSGGFGSLDVGQGNNLTGGHQAVGGAASTAGQNGDIARRLEDLLPAEPVMSMALADDPEGPAAACFAACEAGTARVPPRGTPVRVAFLAKGGPFGGGATAEGAGGRDDVDVIEVVGGGEKAADDEHGCVPHEGDEDAAMEQEGGI